MTTNSRGVLVLATVFLLCPALMGQAGNARRPTPRRSERTNAETPPATPPKPADRGPGVATPPEQGYVPPPDQTPAGTAAPPLIPSDPLDRAYWELYDRDKRVTLTGKVRRVDWSNPNSYIYLMVDGQAWLVESGFIQFRQSSVTPAVTVDQTITVVGYHPREEPEAQLPAEKSPAMSTYLKAERLIRAGEITTEFGQKLVMGQPPSESEREQRLKCSALGC